jgi:hypothetical protein
MACKRGGRAPNASPPHATKSAAIATPRARDGMRDDRRSVSSLLGSLVTGAYAGAQYPARRVNAAWP